MIRRLFWLLLGAGAGAWAVVRVQQVAAQLTPSGVAASARRYVVRLLADIAAALAEGSRTRREVEAQLRSVERPAVGLSIDARAVSTRPALGTRRA